MKRIIYTFLMGLVYAITATGQPYDLTLNTAESGTQLHQALNSITLASGYSYSPSGGTMLSEIIRQSISGNVAYSSAINPSTYVINTSLPVGKTPGSLAVGGSASYSIPIEIPAGTNGLQPSILLNYSSDYSDGILGVGWDLGGLSAINRTNKTIYNDGKSDAIRCDITDKYSLDGKRLVAWSGSTYGADNSIYGTELEEFSKVVAHGATGQGPEYFTVYLKSGLIYEYGNTTDSKLKNGNCIITWKLNKITDRYNNYIRFIYVANDDELSIDKIEYSGNGTQQSPFAQILFNYKTRADVSSYIYAGKEFTRDILLDNIEVRCNGQLFKKYGLDYMRDTFAQLQKVTQYSSQNVALNPTVFTWTDQTENFTQTANYSSSIDELLYVGDFNGDGREDLVTVPKKATYTSTDKWKLYLADAYGTMVYSDQGDLNSQFETFLVGDFNGDGMTDLVMQQNPKITQYPNRRYYYFYSSVETSFYRNPSYFVFDNYNAVRVVDYNGDGVLEFMFFVPPGSWYLSSYLGNPIYNNSIPDLGTYIIDDPGNKASILDFNGDGCSDLLTLFSSGYKLYEFKGSNNALIETYSGTNLTSNDILLFGDFNGDGSTDILKRTSASSGSSSYLMTLQSGGFQSKTLNAFGGFDINSTNNRIFARDMDGDGRTDIVFAGKGTSNSNSYTRINVALSNGNGFNTPVEYITSTLMQNGDERYFNFGDFNGDGRYQMLYKYYSTSNLFSFATGTPSHLINNVVDGLGAKSTLTYLPMSNSAVYTRGYGAIYPVIDFSSSMQLVSQVSSDNGIGGNSTIAYIYAGAKVHREGKGFLTFSKILITDVANGLLTETQSGYSSSYFYPKVNTVTKKTIGNSLIETTSNTWANPEIILDASTKRIFPYISATTQTNSLTGLSVTTTISSVDNYGNAGQVVKNYNNGVTETTMTNYSTWRNTTDWLVGRIGSSTITYTKSGETAVSHTVRYTYNSDGITKPDFIYYNEASPLEFYKNHDYDSKGNLIQIYTYGSSISAIQINYTYDSNGVRLATQTDELGHKTTYFYDPSFDRLLTEKNYLEKTDIYQYDTSDRLYKVINPEGSLVTTTYVWTGTNKPTLGVYGVTQTGNDGSVSTVWYDRIGRAIRTEKKGFGGSMILTDTEYNAKGQVYRISDPYFAGGSVAWAETYNTYDSYGRVIDIIRNTDRNTTYSFTYGSSRVTETTAGKTSWKETDSQGLLIQAHDNGGDLTYTYYPDGKIKNITAPGGAVTSMLYADAARNQTRLSDPSAGPVNYTYDSLGRVKTQTNARNQSTTYNYYPDGRIDNIVAPEGTTTYSYNTSKQLTGISSPNSVSKTYDYDTFGRVTSVGENIAGSNFTTGFTYDSYGRLNTRTHPSGIVETYGYNTFGYLVTISAGGSTRYTLTSMNAREQLTGATYGSNLTAAYGFNMYGYPNSTVTGSIQEYRYSFDSETGNLNSRTNILRNKSETFVYDNLDRLKEVWGPQDLTMSYNDNGNILIKSDISSTTEFTYGNNAGPYSLTGASSSTGVIPTVSQTITYTSLEKVSTITEGNYNAVFVYNSDNQRARMDITQSGTNILTRWYAGSSYMKETASGVTKEYTYIGGDAYHAPVVAVSQGGTTTYYYLLRDYLGNITHQVNTSNTVVAEYSFDAWGRRRNPTNWGYDLTSQPELFADRGFTGHEYLKYFNLYNMNGRMYDPLVGRFISPDPFVQAPSSTQSMNRYTYCMNNPLVYVDYNGYTWLSKLGKWIDKNSNQIITITATVVVVGVLTVATAGMGTLAAGAIVGFGGAFTSGSVGSWTNGGSFLQGIGTGALNGIIGAGAGMAGGWAANLASKYLGGFAINTLEVSGRSAIGGIISGGSGGYVGGFVGGFVTGLATTGDLNEAWKMGKQGGKIGVISGSIFGGYRGYKAAQTSGSNPWTGKSLDATTSNSSSTSLHASERAIERNVNQNNIDDAVNNPLKVSEVKYDSQGRPSVKYIGKGATVIINPETGKIITVYPTSTQRLNSLLKND